MNVYFFFGLFGGGSGKSLSCTHPVPLGGFGSERIVHGLLVLGGEFRLLLWGGLRRLLLGSDRREVDDLGEGAPLGLLVIDVEDHGTALELVLSDLLAVGELPAKDAPGPPAGLANS
jgi:hypothetical protein